MTQKELAYIEDAYCHEKNIIEILSNMIDSSDDDEIISFLTYEQDKHNTIKDNLINKLEEIING